jgi:hypothetical protein
VAALKDLWTCVANESGSSLENKRVDHFFSVDRFAERGASMDGAS